MPLDPRKLTEAQSSSRGRLRRRAPRRLTAVHDGAGQLLPLLYRGQRRGCGAVYAQQFAAQQFAAAQDRAVAVLSRLVGRRCISASLSLNIRAYRRRASLMDCCFLYNRRQAERAASLLAAGWTCMRSTGTATARSGRAKRDRCDSPCGPGRRRRRARALVPGVRTV